MNVPVQKPSRWRKLAHLGFWFFLLKGVLWLTLPAAIGYFGWFS